MVSCVLWLLPGLLGRPPQHAEYCLVGAWAPVAYQRVTHYSSIVSLSYHALVLRAVPAGRLPQVDPRGLFPFAAFNIHWFCNEFERHPANRNRNPTWPVHLERPDWVSSPADRIPFKIFANSIGFESGKGRAHESIPVSVSRARV